MDALHTNDCQPCAQRKELYHQAYEATRKRQCQIEQLTDSKEDSYEQSTETIKYLP